jgi:amino acid transporter
MFMSNTISSKKKVAHATRVASTPHLATGALGSAESIVMGIAGTAPAFSVAITTATIVAAVGELAVGSIVYCGLIMFGIMLAFTHLNKAMPSAGATYTWVGHVFGRTWGFFSGWAMLVASVFFMVSATIPAATSTLLIVQNLLGDAVPANLVDDTYWVAWVASVWLVLVTALVCKGIQYASYVQVLFTVIETVIMLALIVAGLMQYGHLPAHSLSLAWVSPMSFTPTTFATGALTAIFFYWGWDVTMNLGEESRSDTAHSAASTGAFWAMINLILFFVIMITVVLMVLTDAEIAAANTNVLYAVADKLLPKPWSHLAVLSTILSTIGTIETQILQFSRGLFAMSRDQALHPRYARIHPTWQTPWVASLVIGGLGIALLAAASQMASVKAIVDSSVNAIGFHICFYMSLAGLACAWHSRAMLKQGSLKQAVSQVVWPWISAMFLMFLIGYLLPTFDALTAGIALGGLALGWVPWYLNVRRA